MVVKCLSEAVFLSEPEESDSLCLFEEGGGGRRGTSGTGLDSGSVGCVSGFALLGEVRFDLSSKSKVSSCTTTSSTSASLVWSGARGTSSQTEPVTEGLGDGGAEKSLLSFCFSSSFSSIFLSTSADSPSFSSSISSESPKPSCSRARAMFLR